MRTNKYNRKYPQISEIQNPNMFYTIPEVCRLLGEKNSFNQVFFNWIVDDYLFEHFEKTTSDGKQIQVPVFYRGRAGYGLKSFYILKEALPSFVRLHHSELEEMGVSKDILYVIENDFTRIEKYTNDYMRLWDVGLKFTQNRKSVQPIVDFIYQNLLTATYSIQDEHGKLKTEKMFVSWVPNNGTPRFFLKKQALDSFMKQFGTVLGRVARKAEKDTEFVSLRYLSRQLNTQYILLDSDLKRFIEENCLDDTFVETNENGEEQIKKIFEVGKGNELYIRKSGIQSFVINHRSELRALGLNNFSYIAEGVQKIQKPKNMYTIQQVATRLGFSKKYDAFYNWIQEHLLNAVIERTNNKGETVKRQLFMPYMWNGEKRYYITKNDLKQVVFRYRNKFLELGALPEVLDELSGVGKVRKKTKEMISFNDFYPMLAEQSRKHQETTKEILEKFGDETYSETDDRGNTIVLPIFERVKSGPMYISVFTSEKAMHSFVSKHRDFLTDKGINLYIIKDLIGEKPIVPMSDKVIPITDLDKVLHFSDYQIIRHIRNNYLNETYFGRDETGKIVEKDMFVWATVRNKGIGCICIYKEALPYFAERHQKELNIQPIVVDELFGRVQVISKTADLITIKDLCKIFGKTSEASKKRFSDFIQSKCMQDTFLKCTKNHSCKQALFRYVRQPSGHVCICMDSEGLLIFIKRYDQELKDLGVNCAGFHKAYHYAKNMLQKVNSDYVLNCSKTIQRA